MGAILDKFMEYVNNATPEQLQADWEELEHYCDIGASVFDFLPDIYTCNIDENLHEETDGCHIITGISMENLESSMSDYYLAA